MIKDSYETIKKKVAEAVVLAGSTFRQDKIKAYQDAIKVETQPRAKWILETILENAEVAARNRSPLCDDTGIPHLLLDVGEGSNIPVEMLDAIKEGVETGLRCLPGRPMGIKGNDRQRLDQSGSLDMDSGAVLASPIQIRKVKEKGIKLHILMQGGGPAIRGKTLRIFHKHSVQVVLDEIISWANEAVAQLGCSPCTLCIGIGRSQYEATALMMQAQVDGVYGIQSDMEEEITKRVNQSNIGPMGLCGDISVLATFMKVGPQRASGVRVVCLRPCCCFEPRIATVELTEEEKICR